MQGHPEAPRIWFRHIHCILTTKMNLKATTYKPCLYTGTYQGRKIFLIRQVDDFAVLTPSKNIAIAFYHDLGEYPIKPLKMQDVLTYFNSINLIQARNCITVNC